MFEEMKEMLDKMSEEKSVCACASPMATTQLLVLLGEKCGIKPKDLGKMLVEEQEELAKKTLEFAKAGLVALEERKHKVKIKKITDL